MNQYLGTIEKIIQETPTIKLFQISLDDKMFDYIPGQFVIFSLDYVRNEKDHLIRRSYSIASSPLNKDYLEFCITIKPDGKFTPHLDKLLLGDTINISGPYGKFNLVEETNHPRITSFIATGAGIAPLMSMMRTLILKNLDQKIQLLYGFREPEDFCYKKELATYEAGNFEIKPTISTKNPPKYWLLDKGRVTSIITKYLMPQETQSVYICGNPEMVRDTTEILHNLGLEKRKIHKEQW